MVWMGVSWPEVHPCLKGARGSDEAVWASASFSCSLK